MTTDSMTPSTTPPPTITADERKVIFASSLGTVFEWYDFYLYATLATFFAGKFFPKGNDTAALLSALATYAAGFAVRPFGALVFGRVGDLVGRKYTFLVTITVMGISTFGVGLLPTYDAIGVAAPILLTLLRLLQGLALGGEYGGAVIYVAEHTRQDRRGYSTSWIQTTATVGFFLSLLVIGMCRGVLFSADDFLSWGWRVPFWFSVVLLGFSLYIRLKLSESPVFLRMKSENRVSKQPLIDSFFRYPNVKYVVLALFGAVAGQGVVWYTGQFYVLFFLQTTLQLDWLTVYLLLGAALAIGTPMFLVFGRLSDRIGRVKIILAGCLLAAIVYFPLFKGLTHFANPALEEFRDKTAITVAATDCEFHIFTTANTVYSKCDRVTDFLTKRGLSFQKVDAVAGQDVVTKLGATELRGWDAPKPTDPDLRYVRALKKAKLWSETPLPPEVLTAAKISVTGADCHPDGLPAGAKPSECDQIVSFLTKRQLVFVSAVPAGEQKPDASGKLPRPVTKINDLPPITGWDAPKGTDPDQRYALALSDQGYPATPQGTSYIPVLVLLVVLIILVTMVYGPIAALLVELFPAKIRYTSMSFPYHLANGWIGGMLPLVATAMAAGAGNIYYGLWYPVVVAVLTVIVGGLFLRDAKPGFDIHD